jgi:hypothetical protein
MACTRCRDSVWGRRELVFRGGKGKCAGNSRGINRIRAELVFRGAHQECSHNSKKIRAFLPELVFRQIPGKSVQWGGQTQGLRRPFLRAALLDAVARGILRVLRAPVRLRLLPSCRLALRLAAGMLARSDSRVRTEPSAAKGARSFPGRGHRASSSPRCGMPSSFRSTCLGHSWKAKVGKFSRAPKGASEV